MILLETTLFLNRLIDNEYQFFHFRWFCAMIGLLLAAFILFMASSPLDYLALIILDLYRNIFTSVCQEFCPQWGMCLPQCMLGYTPPGQTPPLGQTPPPADGYCSGRYASYWNAFLYKFSITATKIVLADGFQ